MTVGPAHRSAGAPLVFVDPELFADPELPVNDGPPREAPAPLTAPAVKNPRETRTVTLLVEDNRADVLIIEERLLSTVCLSSCT